MKNFLAIIGCFTLAIGMIAAFASCGRRDQTGIDDPKDSVTQDAEDIDEKDDKDIDEGKEIAEDGEEEATSKKTNSTGSSFLDTLLGGVEDVVSEALGGAANVVEEALAGAADKVNSALNDEND